MGWTLYPPSFTPKHSWIMSMALKGPQLGLGRTKNLERKGKKKGELLFSFQSWCQYQPGGWWNRKVASEFSPSD